ncbi:MAG: metallophosphoesterase, partial [Clostridia bacterium]|nr:metallophosphoesterase [Clostridia bacterium]
MLKTTPAVFAVGKNYQIMVPVTEQSLFYVKVGDKTYYDEANGIMRSLELVHRVTVPQAELDAAGGYTAIERRVIERKPYFPLIDDEVATEFKFYPVPEKNARAYHIADAHNRRIGPAKAAALYGEVDFLILNGDLPDHSGKPENFTTIYEIAESVTHGEKPVVFARGNHDLRGLYAEKFADYTPQENGNTYYTFRLGSIWGIVLDGGEDKDDSSDEYYHTVACHQFRERETSFIHDVIKNAESEYAADGIKTRLVVAHNPFTHQLEP